MSGTPIEKTDLRERYRLLLELFELTIPDRLRRQRLALRFCPGRFRSLRQTELQYAYAAKYVARSSSPNDPRVKALVRAIAGETDGVA